MSQRSSSGVSPMAAALLRHGPRTVTETLAGVAAWFQDRDYDSVAQARGSVSQVSVPDPVLFERAQYFQALRSYPAPPTGGRGVRPTTTPEGMV